MWKTKERVYYGICKERQGPQLDRMNIIEILIKGFKRKASILFN